VIEGVETRADKFEKAMEEDKPSVEHDGMTYNPENPKETLEYKNDKITAIEEGLDHKGEDDLPPPEELIPLIKEETTSEPVSEPAKEEISEIEMLEEFTEDSIDFEKEDLQKRERIEKAESSFLNSDVSNNINVEL